MLRAVARFVRHDFKRNVALLEKVCDAHRLAPLRELSRRTKDSERR
jgi:hypothetical protein